MAKYFSQQFLSLNFLQYSYNRIMEVRAERFKKAGSTPSDVPIETLIICTYCREKCYWIIKTKILRRLFYQ